VLLIIYNSVGLQMDTIIKVRRCHRFLLYITVLILRWLFVVYANSVI